MTKWALVTGASQGIGKEFAKILAKEGYSLILIARSLKSLEELKLELSNNYLVSIKILSLDLSELNCIDILFHIFRFELRSLEILINNAGYGIVSKFADMKDEDVKGIVSLNIRALTELTYRILPFMVENKQGKILNLASVASYMPGPYMAMYYASKAYVLSFSEALHYEYKNQGITITALCPGITLTQFQKRAGILDFRINKKYIPKMTAVAVAKLGYQGLMLKKPVVVTGFRNKLFVFLMKILPRKWAAQSGLKMYEL